MYRVVHSAESEYSTVNTYYASVHVTFVCNLLWYSHALSSIVSKRIGAQAQACRLDG